MYLGTLPIGTTKLSSPMRALKRNSLFLWAKLLHKRLVGSAGLVVERQQEWLTVNAWFLTERDMRLVARVVRVGRLLQVCICCLDADLGVTVRHHKKWCGRGCGASKVAKRARVGALLLRLNALVIDVLLLGKLSLHISLIGIDARRLKV